MLFVGLRWALCKFFTLWISGSRRCARKRTLQNRAGMKEGPRVIKKCRRRDGEHKTHGFQSSFVQQSGPERHGFQTTKTWKSFQWVSRDSRECEKPRSPPDLRHGGLQGGWEHVNACDTVPLSSSFTSCSLG